MAEILGLEPIDPRGIDAPGRDPRWRAVTLDRTWLLPNCDHASKLIGLAPKDRVPYLTEHYEDEAHNG